MDDKGNIREFVSDEQAKREGYRHMLSPAEADELRKLPETERLVEMKWRRFHAKCLESRKVDVMEKARYKLAIKFILEDQS